jgi:1-acyl-sn-glycerol-3-phosphate acyltransferase
MQNIVIDKPYVPVPPHRGNLWPKLLSFYAPRMLRKKFRVERVDIVHEERLKNSLSQGHGILLAPNHCRDEDPFVLGMLSKHVGTPFFIVASWHLFMQSRLQTFLLTRAGAFSIYREGIDRTAVNTAVEILETAERPLVIFPEGFISRSNDRLNDLMDGTGLIVRSAAKKRAKLEPPRKVVVHPVAMRYHFHGNIQSAAEAVLDDIERRLTWRPLKGLPLLDRIYKTGNALLSLKELEYLGHAREGELGTRLKNLIDAILVPLEDEWVEGRHDDPVPARVKRLRSAILPDMTKDEIDEAERDRRWKQLADLYLAQQLFNYPPDYVRSNATPERILETVERFEEDLTDRIRVHGPSRATVTVGEAIEVAPTREGRGAGDPLMEQIGQQLRAMLGLEGPA